MYKKLDKQGLQDFLKSISNSCELYGCLGKIIEDLTDKLIQAVGKGMVTDFTAIINGIQGSGFFTAIISLIFFMYFFFYIFSFNEENGGVSINNHKKETLYILLGLKTKTEIFDGFGKED